MVEKAKDINSVRSANASKFGSSMVKQAKDINSVRSANASKFGSSMVKQKKNKNLAAEYSYGSSPEKIPDGCYEMPPSLFDPCSGECSGYFQVSDSGTSLTAVTHYSDGEGTTCDHTWPTQDLTYDGLGDVSWWGQYDVTATEPDGTCTYTGPEEVDTEFSMDGNGGLSLDYGVVVFPGCPSPPSPPPSPPGASGGASVLPIALGSVAGGLLFIGLAWWGCKKGQPTPSQPMAAQEQ